MSIFLTIGLIFLAIIVFVGIIRVIFSPYDGFLNFLLELFILDLLGDALEWILFEIFDVWND